MIRHGQEKKNGKDYHGGQTVSFIFIMKMQFFFQNFLVMS